jgi:surface antigen
MPAHAPHSATRSDTNAGEGFQLPFLDGLHHAGPSYDSPGGWELEPGERIGPPLKKRSKAMRRVVFVGLVMVGGLGGVWALASDHMKPPEWLAEKLATTFSDVQRAATELASRYQAAPPALAPPLPIPPAATATSMKPIETERVVAMEPAPSAETAAATATEQPLEAPPAPEPLTPPSADPADPNQKRALAAGLHPQLSRVLLARMSAADYRNAAHAVKTALAETPDTEVFVWPRQRKPDEALFNVRFVQGASVDCRRYVVSITKDGWLTTALPMETCGLKPVVVKAKP